MTLRRGRIALVSLVFGLVSLSCKSSTGPSLLSCSDPSISGGGGEILTVSSGTTPTFSWSPGCLAYSLVVTDDTGAVMWGVASDSGNTMPPPVGYGVVPGGPHHQLQAPTALIAGKQYAVGLYRFYIGSPTPSDVLGAIAFRP